MGRLPGAGPPDGRRLRGHRLPPRQPAPGATPPHRDRQGLRARLPAGCVGRAIPRADVRVVHRAVRRLQPRRRRDALPGPQPRPPVWPLRADIGPGRIEVAAAGYRARRLRGPGIVARRTDPGHLRLGRGSCRWGCSTIGSRSRAWSPPRRRRSQRRSRTCRPSSRTSSSSRCSPISRGTRLGSGGRPSSPSADRSSTRLRPGRRSRPPSRLVRRAVPLGRGAVERRPEHPGRGGRPNVTGTLERRRAATARRAARRDRRGWGHGSSPSSSAHRPTGGTGSTTRSWTRACPTIATRRCSCSTT